MLLALKLLILLYEIPLDVKLMENDKDRFGETMRLVERAK
jgi:hypothetical protein